MDLAITPHVGVGPIKFGMGRAEVRLLLPSDVTEFMKTPDSEAPTDSFVRLDLHVFYDKDETCTAVEMFERTEPTFMGRKLVGEPFRALADWLIELDPALELDSNGLISRRFGLALWAPDAETAGRGPVTAVYVCRRGELDA